MANCRASLDATDLSEDGVCGRGNVTGLSPDGKGRRSSCDLHAMSAGRFMWARMGQARGRADSPLKLITSQLF